MEHKISRQYKISGFSILEVMIAITIITIGITGLFSLIIQNSKIYYTNKNRFIAVMLAQEGEELARNWRDSNWLQGLTWDDNINSGAGVDGTFIIDYASAPNHAVNDINNAALYLDANKRYTHTADGNTATRFKRLITISNPDGCAVGDCFKLASQVQWSERGQTYNYELDVLMYNWRQ